MRVVEMKDIINVLEDHLDTSVAAGIVLDLIDLWFEIDEKEKTNESIN